MTEKESISFDSVEEFTAHAHALEQEIAQRYEETAHCMETHNNVAVAELLHKLSQYGEIHTEKLIQNDEAIDLPQVPPWEYQWLSIAGTEHCMEETHYLMTTRQALEMAIGIEQGSRRFYELTVQGTSAALVKQLAAEMVEIKQAHLKLLNDWLSREPERDVLSFDDLDPPNMPE